jgi:SAM-dependent methyltransferase
MNEQEHHDVFYREHADRIMTHPLFVRLQRRAALAFLRWAGLGPNSEVLSLASGDGAIEGVLAPHVKQIHGLEISQVGVDRARSKASAAGLTNATFEVADLNTWAPANGAGRYDAVCAFNFFHHIADDGILRLLQVSRPLLKSGGVFYSTDPSDRRLVSKFRFVVRKQFDEFHTEDEHELNPERLCGLYRQAGFVDPQVNYIDYFAGPVAWLMAPPAWIAWGIDHFDRLLLHTPGVRRFASSFAVIGRTA